MSKHPNVLVIGDTHEPFCHPDYLEFCKETARRYGCTEVVHIGDEVDNHALSYHEHDPDGDSAAGEMERAMKAMRRWYKAFPKVKVCVGNHSALPFRKAYTAGLPKRWLKAYEAVWEAPEGWSWDMRWEINGVIYRHGTGSSGKNAALGLALKSRMPTVSGHTHTFAGVQFHASEKDIVYGLNVGCGIDRHAYAFTYAKENADKPVLGCGVVTEAGRVPFFVPMKF